MQGTWVHERSWGQPGKRSTQCGPLTGTGMGALVMSRLLPENEEVIMMTLWVPINKLELKYLSRQIHSAPICPCSYQLLTSSTKGSPSSALQYDPCCPRMLNPRRGASTLQTTCSRIMSVVSWVSCPPSSWPGHPHSTWVSFPKSRTVCQS